MELTLRLGAWMLVVSGLAQSVGEGEARCAEALASGRALELFLANLRRQGGDVDRMFELRGRYRSEHSAALKAPASGWLSRVDAWKIGLAGVDLGVGRNRTEDRVSPDVGFVFEKRRGDKVTAGDLVATLYGASEAGLASALRLAEQALEVSPSPQPVSRLIIEELSSR
jgi:pyrimidine-nucleoside phosphorylase